MRVLDICKKEEIGIDKHAAVELVKRKFPDLRNMLNVLQGFKREGKEQICVDDIKNSSSVFKDVYELILFETDPVKNYKHLLSNYSNKIDDVLGSLGAEFIQYIEKEESDYIKFIPQIVVTVSKYQSQKQFVIDPTISMLACVFELQSICNGV